MRCGSLILDTITTVTELIQNAPSLSGHQAHTTGGFNLVLLFSQLMIKALENAELVKCFPLEILHVTSLDPVSRNAYSGAVLFSSNSMKNNPGQQGR